MTDELRLRVSVINATRRGFRAVLTSLAGFTRAAVGMFRGILGAIGRVVKGVGAIGAAIGGLTALTLRSFFKQEEAEIRLAAVIKATGQAAGFTVEQLKKQAAELQKQTGFADETILALQAVLATFKEIKGDQFKRATRAILDMSAVMQQDARGAAIQLGKALNDPLKGITALSRSGVSFTDQEKKKIKTLVESNKIIKAQQIVLEALEGQFQDTAQTLRQSVGGAWQNLCNSFGDFLERVGQVIAKTFNLRQAFEDAAKWIDRLAESGKLQEWAQGVKRFLGEALEVLQALIEGGEKRAVVFRAFGEMGIKFVAIVVKGLLWIAPVLGRIIGRAIMDITTGAIQKSITDPAEIRRAAYREMVARFGRRRAIGAVAGEMPGKFRRDPEWTAEFKRVTERIAGSIAETQQQERRRLLRESVKEITAPGSDWAVMIEELRSLRKDVKDLGKTEGGGT